MRSLAGADIFSLYPDCRLRSLPFLCSPWLKSWEAGTPRNYPGEEHQTDETKAGEHQDIGFRIEPTCGLDVKEKSHAIIDQMGEHRCPKAACPVIQVAEHKSADGGKDQQSRGFSGCFSCR